MITLRALIAVTASALALCGCAAGPDGTRSATPAGATPAGIATAGPGGAGTATPEETASTSPPGPTASASVPKALRFTAKTLEGEAFAGDTLAGKPVVFWFWAPWCPKCRSEAPNVKKAADTYQDVSFVGIASLDSEAAMKEFVQQTGTGGLTHLSDEKGTVWAKFGIASQSTFLFMRPDGTTTKATGPLGAEELTAYVKKLRAG
ncbi:TlpA family protein disulfide reductase [Sphaerisporangium dianthi]|uniref:Redoxin domain-containing protein n=1 Tax=Sphaerisporangium dianthi TaxID=1436120 RepID=A0ABV9CLT3_9ACTN